MPIAVRSLVLLLQTPLLFIEAAVGFEPQCVFGKRSQPPGSKNVYKIGVLANRGVDKAIQEFNETFATYLTTMVGPTFDPPVSFEMEPVTFGTVSAIDKFEQGFDFMFANPSVFSCVESEVGATSLLTFISRRVVKKEAHLLTKFGGVVVARSDNDEVNSLRDVPGKIVGTISISGLGSGQMQFRELQKLGIHHLQDVKQLLFMGNQGKIVKAVLDGSIDVGFVRTDQLERYIDSETGELLNLTRVKVIGEQSGLESDGKPFPFPASTPLYPEWAFGAVRAPPDIVVSAVQKELYQMAQHASIVPTLETCYISRNCTEDICRDECFWVLDKSTFPNCDTTRDLAHFAWATMAAGKYGGWRISLPYMDLRNMQEATGFIEPSTTDRNARCVRSSEIADAVVCPPDHLKKTNEEIKSGCADAGLDCYGFQCLCSPCAKIVEEDDGNSLPDHYFYPIVIVPSVLVFVILAALFHERRKHRKNFLWRVKPEELEFSDPPRILGRGTFGVVLLAEYRGTMVAVKRILPPKDTERSASAMATASGQGFKSHQGLKSSIITEKRGVFFGQLENVGDEDNGVAVGYEVPVDIEVGFSSPRKLKTGEDGAVKSVKWNLVDVEKKRTKEGRRSIFDFGGLSSTRDGSKAKESGVSSSSGSRSGSNNFRKRLRGSEYKELQRQFVDEMRSVSRLRHPSITTVLGAVIEHKSSEPMLVMEHMELGSLYDLLHNDSMIIEGDILLPILRDVSSGLRFLHAASICHADLKSANVLVDSKFRAKVTDFGFSQKKWFSKSNQAAGTPYFMAPELLRGESTNSTASDVFSFGVVLFEVFARAHPYEDEPFDDILDKVADPKIQKRPEIDHDKFPKEMIEMMKACWKNDPQERPSSEDIDVRLRMLDADTVQPEKNVSGRRDMKEARTEALLLELFPAHVSKALREGKKVEPESFECVTVCFLDIVGYTEISSKLTPLKVSNLLDRLYTKLDGLSKTHNVFKVETIGDAFMAVTNLAVPQPEHARIMAFFVLDAVEAAGSILVDNDNPALGYVSLRVGMHSGPVVAHVVGTRTPRYSIIGDTVNTASRMESSSRPRQIHMSEDAASLLNQQAPDFIIKCRGIIPIKGKGHLKTYFLLRSMDESWGGGSSSTDAMTGDISNPISTSSMTMTSTKLDSSSTQRLVNWNVNLILRLLKQIVAHRQSAGGIPIIPKSNKSSTFAEEQSPLPNSLFDELKEIIEMPKTLDKKAVKHEQFPIESITLPAEVVSQVKAFVSTIACTYRDNAFHSFEHASHVVISVVKLMSQVVAPTELDGGHDAKDIKTMHKFSYGIASDPLTQLAIVISALVHDVDHPGVPNATLVQEKSALALRYSMKSVAEQNSIDISWSLLLQDSYKELRQTIYTNQEEYTRFRALLVNAVMATDIMDKDLKVLRNQRWSNAFDGATTTTTTTTTTPSSSSLNHYRNANSKSCSDRKATIVMEHMIQVSDVAHTCEHWTVYRKWNERYFVECCHAYRQGRAEHDPADDWYPSELGFLDFYVIPLAQKLQACGVFGPLGEAYLSTARRNRQQWEACGQQVVEEMVERYRLNYESNNNNNNANNSLGSTSSSSASDHDDNEDAAEQASDPEVFQQEPPMEATPREQFFT